MKILVTGHAGFIGMHTARRLAALGHDVVGIDSFDPYYDPGLKRARAAALAECPTFEGSEGDLRDPAVVAELFSRHRFDRVVHLAAQPGVRYSLENPHAYVASNLTAFMHVLDAARKQDVSHFVYASSSSVYGGNANLPYRETDPVDHPVSLYAATKRANELMAHTYSHLYGLPTTGLRFFTVYGPWGRPDMSPMLFADAILSGRTIDVFNQGRSRRDFTYIDDIVEGVVRVTARPSEPDLAFDRSAPVPDRSWAPYRVYNIGNHDAIPVLRFIEVLEHALGRKAAVRLLPAQPGDVEATYADVTALSSATGFAPSTPVEEGVARFVTWYRAHFRR